MAHSNFHRWSRHDWRFCSHLRALAATGSARGGPSAAPLGVRPTVSARANGVVPETLCQEKIGRSREPPEQENLLDFFETIGLLVNRGYLNGTDVWETFSSEIIPLRADSRDWLEQEQKKDPTEYSNFTGLADLMESIDQEHHGTLSKPSKEDMQEFRNDELATEVNSPMPKHTQRHRVVAPR